MKDDRLLRDVLQHKIAQIKEYPRSAQKEVEQEMATKFNVKHGRTVDIFNNIEPIESMPYHMLYKLMISIREVALSRYTDLDASDLFEDTYFTENEKVEYKQPLEDSEDDFDLIFKDWSEISLGQYRIITIRSNIDEKIRLRDYNKLRFNPDTQRDLITIKTKGVSIKKLDINRKAVNSMKELMKRGLYFPVTCVININPDLYEEPVIIRGKELIIPKENHIDLIEGFHNYMAECEVKDENPEWEFPCEFKLMFLNKEDANRFITQMDKKNHFTDEQLVRIDKQSQENYIINRLNTSSDFHLAGTINKDLHVYLNKILKNLFNIQDRQNAVQIFETILENLNYVVEKTNHFKKPFSKEEWFIYLNIIKPVVNAEIKFKELYDFIVNTDIYEKINIKNSPTAAHFSIMKKYIKEVIDNVQ